MSPPRVSYGEKRKRKRECVCYFRRDRIPTALLRLMTSRTTKGGTYLPYIGTYIPLPYTVMRPGSVPVEREKKIAISVGLIQRLSSKTHVISTLPTHTCPQP